MKYFITLIVLFIITLTTQGQITETNVSAVATTVGRFDNHFGSQAALSQRITDGDTTYTLKFKSFSEKNLHEISFSGNGGTLNSLYKIIISFFYPENKKNKNYQRTFKLGEEDVTCTAERAGKYSVIFNSNQGFFLMTEKECDKLFGK